MITRWPRSEDRLSSRPSASGRVKSGARSPGASRSSVTYAPLCHCACPTVPAPRPHVRLAVARPPPGGAAGLAAEERSDHRGERSQCAAAMADRVLVRRGHLGRRLIIAVGDEDRVVAEAVLAARQPRYPAVPLALADVLAAGRQDERRRAGG